ncbi:CbrC family protein [Streptomyces phaeochromogenes]|uniref:CbrC family protein n=1 Tax=Streptomyces phaeochromogenes TaxID=1923 RepID=UPI003402FC18
MPWPSNETVRKVQAATAEQDISNGSLQNPGGGRPPHPGFHAWQDPHWLVHCHDAAAFLGEVGYTELVAHPDALDHLRLDLRMSGWHDAAKLEHFLTHLGQGASAMLFRCTVCGTHLAYVDASQPAAGHGLRPTATTSRVPDIV